MKKILLLALVAFSLPLFAGTLADFGNGLGRAVLSGGSFFSAPFETEFVDDAIAPAPGRVLVVKIPAPKGKHGRFNLAVLISAEEAAQAKAVAFDVRADNPSAVSWASHYLFPIPKKDKGHLIAPSGSWAGTKPNEWKHIELPIDKFRVVNGEITPAEARQVYLSFFCVAPVELRFANLKLLDK